MKTDLYESDIRFSNKWNCFFSLLQFQVDWCNQNNDNLKTRQNKKEWSVETWLTSEAHQRDRMKEQ